MGDIIFRYMRSQRLPLFARSMLILCLVAPGALRAQLSPVPQYFGDIKRNAQGDLVIVTKPEAPPADGPDLSPTPILRNAAPALPRSNPTTTLAVRPAVAKSAASAVLASPGTLRVGPQRPLHSISAAAALARDGDTVEIDAGDYVADVAVWKQDRLTLRGVGGQVRLIAGGASAQGKAIWVIAGGQVNIENVSFSGARVPDKNGAGIRLEQGRLTVKQCVFKDNQDGILTSNNPQTELFIENSDFASNGAGDGYSHNLYVGHIKKLVVTGSYFHHANGGHLLKSRAAENHIFYNRLTDEIGGTASYELEFPNGGLTYVVGNIVQQGSTTQNPTVISYGAEGYAWPRNELYLTYNTIVDDYPKGGYFLAHRPGLDKLLAANNLLVGTGPLTGGLKRWGTDLAKQLVNNKATGTEAKDGEVDTDHNLTTDWAAFVQASRYDYRVRAGKLAEFKVIELGSANGVDLVATREYTFPLGSQKMLSRPLFPGAVQTQANR